MSSFPRPQALTRPSLLLCLGSLLFSGCAGGLFSQISAPVSQPSFHVDLSADAEPPVPPEGNSRAPGLCYSDDVRQALKEADKLAEERHRELQKEEITAQDRIDFFNQRVAHWIALGSSMSEAQLKAETDLQHFRPSRPDARSVLVFRTQDCTQGR